MPVTVVINRGDDGATTCREVYAAAARYQIASSNLEILSAQSQLLALYGSGNWLSVHLDGETPAPTAAAAAAAALNAASAAASAPVEDVDLSPEFVAPEQAAVPDEVAPERPRHVSDPVEPVRDDDPAVYADPSATAGDPGWGLSERLAARSSSLRPVVFRPRTYRAARDAAAGAAAEPAAPRGPASSLRPVVFRARTYRAARPDPAPPVDDTPVDDTPDDDTPDDAPDAAPDDDRS